MSGTLDENTEDATTLWAEIHRLRAALRGPVGFDRWQDAATAERIRRVKAEVSIKELRDALNAVKEWDIETAVSDLKAGGDVRLSLPIKLRVTVENALTHNVSNEAGCRISLGIFPSDDEILEVIKKYHHTMTYVIRNVLSEKYSELKTSRVLKRMEKEGKVERVKSPYVVQICWGIFAQNPVPQTTGLN